MTPRQRATDNNTNTAEDMNRTPALTTVRGTGLKDRTLFGPHNYSRDQFTIDRAHKQNEKKQKQQQHQQQQQNNNSSNTNNNSNNSNPRQHTTDNKQQQQQRQQPTSKGEGAHIANQTPNKRQRQRQTNN
ncbi:unnamed protein product [Polarella glacialis]|uniref:Uncharacterized protein n=1 Tax=Polarella glacialis TaxID=89957 RepID=A0A813HQD5_POLGL|nr:unnamed protein product [Polarella glacialis]